MYFFDKSEKYTSDSLTIQRRILKQRKYVYHAEHQEVNFIKDFDWHLLELERDRDKADKRERGRTFLKKVKKKI